MNIEQDQQLNSLLIDNARDSLLDVVQRHDEFLASIRRPETEQKLLDVAAIAMNIEPSLETVCWTMDAGEYNDSNYDGFRINDITVSFSQTRECRSWWGTDPNERYELEAHEEVDLMTLGDTEPALIRLLSPMQAYLDATVEYWMGVYGAKAKIIINRSGMSSEYYSNQ